MISKIVPEIKALGIRKSIFRAIYELVNYSGVRKILQPPKEPSLNFELTLKEWREKHKRIFLPSLKEAEEILSERFGSEEVIKIANSILKGKMICFSRLFLDFGSPPDWHLNPLNGKRWRMVYWSNVLRDIRKTGDVKFTWEINRFPQFYYLLRAFVLTKNKVYIEEIFNEIRLWYRSNPFRIGVNWVSGHELSIRVISIIFVLYLLKDFFDEETFKIVLKILYLHGKHIYENISFSYNFLDNDHLISEASALYILGTLFPFLDKSKKWKTTGKRILESKKCLNQFLKDGGYFMYSFNYHRLVLHFYLWVIRVGELNGDSFDKRVYDIFEKSLDFLISFVNSEDGKLPNWGANDGSLLNPWSSCDYRDIRPLINTISYLTRKKKVFPSGSWDEELFWFFGKNAIDSPIEPLTFKTIRSFPFAGVHVLRKNGNSFALFRCGDVRDRYGHADQLHVDIWLNGINVSIDGGSFMYNGDYKYHKYFMGTKSHSTVIVDNMDQMILHGKFMWLYRTKAKLILHRKNTIVGEHYGYKRYGVIHRRTLNLNEGRIYEVIDELIPVDKETHVFDLHWLIGDYPYKIHEFNEKHTRVVLFTAKGEICIDIKSSEKGKIFVNRAHNGKEPDGWCSFYYGEKLPAISIHFVVKSDKRVSFMTYFKGE